MRTRTLRFRFAFWTAILLALALAAFGAFVYINTARALSTSIDDSLRLSASQAIAAVNIENGQINFSDSIPGSGNTARELRDRGLTIRVLDLQGQTIQSFGAYATLPVDPPSLAAALHQQATFSTVSDSSEQDPVRFYTAPIPENGELVGVVQVGQSLASLQDTLDRLLATLFVGVPILVLFAAVAGYFLAARALAPIDQITRTARRISAEDLSARLNLPPTDDEVGRLAATFDGMLARLDDSFRRERQFTSDAAHELRTPLAAMQTILGVVRAQRRTSQDYEQALDDLSEEALRLRSLVEALLRLARGESQSSALRETLDLSSLLPDVADSLRPLAESRGLTLTCSVPKGLTVSADVDSLIRLFVNLIDNAVKYTERGSISISGRANGAGVSVIVADTGIGIPAEQLSRVFDRFYRVDASRSTPGAGLGLTIAREIATAHGGTVEVDSALGKGSTFTVNLPRLG
jgi:heavy metal sensor kinase